MADKYLNPTGLSRLWQKIKAYIDGKTAQATDSALGTVKLNPSESVGVNANGQLDVGGRLGQFSSTTGVYSPKSIDPAMVNNGSLLLTEASGTTLGNKSLAVSTGANITCRSAAAGATEYRVQNTYVNRLSLSCMLIAEGVLALNENEASQGNFANVVSVTINGSAYTPDSSANNTATANDIVIKTDKTINPNASTTSIRFYPAEKSFSNLFVGQASGGNGGASVVVGQKVALYSGNACAIVGADLYNAGNGNAVFGRQHISKKNRWLMCGTGHDNTSGRSESGAVFGEFSKISANTAFAVGNGTSQTERSNLFEITDDGGIVLKSPGGTSYKITVADDGTLSTVAV